MDTSGKLLAFSSALLICVAGYLAMSGMFTNYSYWWDELFSVVAASLSMPEMFELLIFRDVHPPLYQILLNIWVSIFGTSESATRALSLAFAALAVIVMGYWCLRNLNRITAAFAVVFFATNYGTVYYAQESRSYAMMLCLATLLTVMYLGHGGKSIRYKPLLVILLVAVALSLTHYFGLVYAGLVILFCLYGCWGDWRKSATVVLAGLLCLVWPALHFAFGTIGQLSNNFWIASNGFESTIAKLAEALVPQILAIETLLPESLHEYVVAIVFIGIFLVITYFARQWARRSSQKRHLFIFTASIIVLFVLIITALDYRSPVSTPRNFIVLLPAFSILVGLAARGIVGDRMRIVTALVVVVGLANLAVSYVLVKDKQQPLENHAQAAEFIIESIQSKGEADVYYTTHGGDELENMMAKFYFDKKRSRHDMALEPIEFNEIFFLSPPFYVFMPHQSHSIPELLAKLESAGIDADYFEPTQSYEWSVVVVYAY